MGKVKAWLMDMDEDATRMSANDFRMRHGECHMYIWETANGPEFPNAADCEPGGEEHKKEEQIK